MRKNAAYYRAAARKLLKPIYAWAILAALLASLLGGLSARTAFNFNFDFSSSESETTVDLPESMESIFQVFEEGGLAAVVEEYPTLLFILCSLFAAVVLFSILFSLFVGAPVTVGYQRYNLDVVDGNGGKLDALFAYFKKGYAKTIGLKVLHSLLLAACSLPLLVTCAALFISNQSTISRLMASKGTEEDLITLSLMMLVMVAATLVTAFLEIWVQYRYAFCYMILAEYPEMRVIDALRNSASLMRGNKWRLFCLEFSFIGWMLLAGITGGIGMIFLHPYMQAAYAVFYDDIANRAAAREAEFPSLNPDDYNPDDYVPGSTQW
jgi:uncharacterized membrane protein